MMGLDWLKGRQDGREEMCFNPSPAFPGGARGKEPASQYGRGKRCMFNPWVGKIPWRRARQPTPYSCLENPLQILPEDRGAWWATVRRVAKSRTRLK